MSKRNKADIEADDKSISDLYLKGYSYREIERLFKADKTRKHTLSHTQIGTDMNRMLKDWRKDRESSIDEWVNAELLKLDKLEQTYWASFEKSIKALTKTKTKTGSNSFGAIDETTMEDMLMLGDPRYLQGIERCIQKRCDLLGLDMPKEISIKTNLDVTEFTFESHPALKAV